MRRALFFIFTFLFCLALAWFLADQFYFSKHIVLKAGEELSEDIVINEGTVLLNEGAILRGSIQLEGGSVTLKNKAQVLGSIQLGTVQFKAEGGNRIEGDLTLKKGHLFLGPASEVDQSILAKNASIVLSGNSKIGGNLTLQQGSLRLEEGVEVEGSVEVGEGILEKHSSAIIHGSKPWVYSTYDWPPALRYFDSLPEDHKQAVGLIFLTKESNILIREPYILSPNQYFEGIYDYKNGELVSVNMRDEALMRVYFKKAKDFFGSLPERRLGVYGVGATTKIYAHDPDFADIYLPAQGSQTLLIHEMGHVLDFKGDFSDFHEPHYPWTLENAVSSYGATHPGEDFAEAYRLYVLSPSRFKILIEEMPERQAKWDFLEEYVFGSH